MSDYIIGTHVNFFLQTPYSLCTEDKAMNYNLAQTVIRVNVPAPSAAPIIAV